MKLWEIYTPRALLEDSSADWVERLKKELADRLEQLPNDEKTLRGLKEIQDILDSAHQGGRIQYVTNELKNFTDEKVRQAHDMLARYVLSLDVDPEDRIKMMELWRTQGLINIDALLDPAITDISKLSQDPSNPAVEAMIKAMFSQIGVGVGKGELALVYLSPKISYPSKGDIEIEGFGRVEVKASDAAGFRFADRQVKPDSRYDNVSSSVSALYTQHLGDLPAATGLNMVNLGDLASELADNSDAVDRYRSLLEDLFSSIFPEARQHSKDIANAVISQNVAKARRLYAIASFDNYASIKQEAGYLFMNLPQNSMVFFTDPREFAKMNFTEKSAYPVLGTGSRTDIYPKITVT